MPSHFSSTHYPQVITELRKRGIGETDLTNVEIAAKCGKSEKAVRCTQGRLNQKEPDIFGNKTTPPFRESRFTYGAAPMRLEYVSRPSNRPRRSSLHP